MTVKNQDEAYYAGLWGYTIEYTEISLNNDLWEESPKNTRDDNSECSWEFNCLWTSLAIHALVSFNQFQQMKWSDGGVMIVVLEGALQSIAKNVPSRREKQSNTVIPLLPLPCKCLFALPTPSGSLSQQTKMLKCYVVFTSPATHFPLQTWYFLGCWRVHVVQVRMSSGFFVSPYCSCLEKMVFSQTQKLQMVKCLQFRDGD